MNTEANKQNSVTTALKIDVGMLAKAIDKLSWSLEDDEMSDPNNEHGSLPITCEEQVHRAKTVLADLRILLPNYIPIVNFEPEFAKKDESTGGYKPLIATVTNTEVEPTNKVETGNAKLPLQIVDAKKAAYNARHERDAILAKQNTTKDVITVSSIDLAYAIDGLLVMWDYFSDHKPIEGDWQHVQCVVKEEIDRLVKLHEHWRSYIVERTGIDVKCDSKASQDDWAGGKIKK